MYASQKSVFFLQGGLFHTERTQTCVIMFTIGLMATRSLLILVTTRTVHILLQCFLVDNLNLRVKMQDEIQITK